MDTKPSSRAAQATPEGMWEASALLRAAAGHDAPYIPADSGRACWLGTEAPACLPSSVLAKWPRGKVGL